jgi:tetratricopeptide (TPR) repeat protein/TolB-like protein
MSRLLMVISLLIILPFAGFAQNTQSWMNEGQNLYKAGRYEEALPNFLKWVESNPEEMRPYYWLGWTYYRLAKYDLAIEKLNKANTINEVWDIYLGLGECYYALKDYEKALLNFSISRKFKPEEASCYQWLGFSYYSLRKYNDAIENIIKANTIKESYDNYNWLGLCYYTLEDYETSLKYYLKFAELHPQNTDLWLPHNKLGWNYYYLQMYYDAIEQFKESIKIKPVNYSYIGLCRIYQAMGEYDKAMDLLTTIQNRLETDAEKQEVRFYLGFNHVAQGRYAEAFKVFGNKNTLGIELKNVNDGLKVIGIQKNSPADLAGLKRGDILLEFGGIALRGKTTAEFVSVILPQFSFGAKLKLQVYRDGYTDDKFIYPGISPEIYNLILNDPDLIRQREQVKESGAGSKLNVAVIDLNTQGLAKEESLALTARVRSELFNTYKFNVLEREDMSLLLNEQSLQQTGVTSDENLAQLGKILNVKYIVGGSVSKIGQYYSVSLKMIDVETGKIKSMPSEDFKGSIDDLLLRGIKGIVYKLIQ